MREAHTKHREAVVDDHQFTARISRVVQMESAPVRQVQIPFVDFGFADRCHPALL